jgi:endonuclease/exonuclease/phosphatase family metal-dependent hydrolase
LSTRVTLATYNVHSCVGLDGRFDPRRIASVLRELDADVIALQEVEHRKVDGLNLPEYFAHATGSTPLVGPTLMRDTRRYGNLLLSRFEVRSCERVDLSHPGREPRGAISAELAVGDLRLHVVATHLGLLPGERRQQTRRLLVLFEESEAEVAVLLGDLNEWLLWGRPLRWLHRHFAPTPHPPTYPSRRPVFALDRLWVRPREVLESLETHRSSLARVASDHLPLRAVLAPDQSSLG